MNEIRVIRLLKTEHKSASQKKKNERFVRGSPQGS